MFSRFITKNKNTKIYLDYASITPTDNRVLEIMIKTMKANFHNAGSLYQNGVKSMNIMNDSRKKIAKLFSGLSTNSVHSDEIFFTSGGTESNNIVLQGVVDKWYEDRNYSSGEKPHIIISEIEHPAIKNVVENLYKKNKISFSKIKVDYDGIIDLKELKEELLKNKNTILVSIMLVNNEIGSIQPIRDIAHVVRKFRDGNVYPLLHTDACQAINYLELQFDKLGVDLLTLDGGKIYGPIGTGVLFIKRKTPINPVYFGGDQESGLRPGTENISGIAGITKALEIVYSEKKEEADRLYKMQQYIFENVKNVSINGSTNNEKRIVNNINLCFKGKDAEFLLFKLDKFGFEVSTGTTCQNKKEDSRSVSVDALGDDCGASSLRISLGRFTTMSEVKKLVQVLRKM